MDPVKEAERLAQHAHAGQKDKAGMPYIDHPRRVAARAEEVDGRPAAVAVAWLHDVVEDTPTTLEELRDAGFDTDVVAAVDAITRRPGEGDDYYRRVAANQLAAVAKRADIWDNTNPERLALLSQADRDRLEQKYRHALEQLSANTEVTVWMLDLRDARVNGIHTHLLARREADGTVRFEGQDFGVPAGLMGNDDEYEYFWTVRPADVPKLVELLGGRLGDEVRDLLKANWTGRRSYDLERVLREAPFRVEFASR